MILYFLKSSVIYIFHYVKSVQMRSFFWSVFSCMHTEYADLPSKSLYSVWIQENTDQKKLRITVLQSLSILIRVPNNCTVKNSNEINLQFCLFLMLSNQLMTSLVFLHWLSLVAFWRSRFILSSIYYFTYSPKFIF